MKIYINPKIDLEFDSDTGATTWRMIGMPHEIDTSYQRRPGDVPPVRNIEGAKAIVVHGSSMEECATMFWYAVQNSLADIGWPKQ